MKTKVMKTKALVVPLVSGLLSVTLLLACVSKENLEDETTGPITVIDLLTSHNVLANPDVTSVFLAEAERTVSFAGASSGNPSKRFTRMVSVARVRQLFRYERVDPLVPTKQIELFDGYAVHQIRTANGKLIWESQRPGDSPSEAVALEIKTFGLLPILGRLQELKTEGNYKGVSEQGLDMLEVEVSGRLWTLYADWKQLIRRLEFDDNAIEYDDYREIAGVRLPLRQQFFRRRQLYFELSFNKIDLNPQFPQDYFSHEAILKNILR